MEYGYDTKTLVCSRVTFTAPGDEEKSIFSSLIDSIKSATEEMNDAVAMNRLKDCILQATKDMKAGFDPAQPRDDIGQWTDVGGGGGSSRPSPSGTGVRKPGIWQELFGVKPAYGEEALRPKAMKVYDAVKHLETNAKPKPPKPGEGECATYVREAIEAGGIKIERADRHNSAKDYGPTLEKVGFRPITETHAGEIYPPKGYKPEKGDVAVIQNTSKGIHGHMAMYSGTQWISDFKQHTFWPGGIYQDEKPKYVIYRAPKG